MAKMMSFVMPSLLQYPRPTTSLSSWKSTSISLIRCGLVRAVLNLQNMCWLFFFFSGFSSLYFVLKLLHCIQSTFSSAQTRSWKGFIQGQDVDSNIRLSLDKWIKKNDEIVRVAPVFLGGSSFLLVLLNRTLSGIAPVADASSAQSRADVIALAMSATVVLTGLVWISVKPKKLIPVELSGIDCLRVDKALPISAATEAMWAWEALRDTTCCRALVIVYKERCVLQAGLASEFEGEARMVDTVNLVKGSLCQTAWRSGKQSYLANLPLYPGRVELGFLPLNTQAVILQPLGDEGIMIVAGDTIRGFGQTDQAWILSIGEKLDTTLGKSG